MKTGDGRRAYDAAVAQLVALNDQLGRMSTDQSKDAESTVDSGRTAILILLAIGAIVGIAIALFVGRLIAGGLQQLVRAARGIAKGDVEQQVDLKSRDELGEAGDGLPRDDQPTSTRRRRRRERSRPAT